MVASGLSNYGGTNAAANIANTALDILHEMQHFRVRHRPEMSMQLRIGIHNGPCAAGLKYFKAGVIFYNINFEIMHNIMKWNIYHCFRSSKSSINENIDI